MPAPPPALTTTGGPHASILCIFCAAAKSYTIAIVLTDKRLMPARLNRRRHDSKLFNSIGQFEITCPATAGAT
jgi:hypothetical protein